ncbi:hypothetical protein ABEF95_011494 [Exophiala dermatitidis]
MSRYVKYGLFVPEGSGYLHVQVLGAGVQGTASLVRSVAEQDLCVRKKTVSVQSKSPSDTFAEVKLYRPHPRIPRLIHTQAYAASEHQTSDFQSYSMIFQYCNGGTLSRLLDILIADVRFRPTPALVWKLFDELLSIVFFLHQECSPAIAHSDAHSSNVFLNFPTEDAKLPDFYLGDFGLARALEDFIWGDQGSTPGQRRLTDPKWLDQVADRQVFKDSVEKLVKDLSSVRHHVCMIITGNRSYDVKDFDEVIDWHKQEQKWPSELISMYDRLRGIITGLKTRQFEKYENLIELRQLVSTFAREQAVEQNPDGSDYSGTRPGKYAVAKAPGGATTPEPDMGLDTQTARFESSDGDDVETSPKLYDSRHKLLLGSIHVPGPWRIAHIDPHTQNVLAVERLDFGYYNMPIEETWPEFLLPPHVAKAGWDAILTAAIIADARDQGTTPPPPVQSWQTEGLDLNQCFEIDPEWSPVEMAES